MEATQYCGFNISSKTISLRLYLTSTTSKATLRMAGMDERYLNGLKMLPITKRKPFAFKCTKESSTRVPGFEEEGTVLNYAENHSHRSVDEVRTDAGKHREDGIELKSHAIIHDFCFGIPYGAILFGGGLFGFLFSRNPVSLTTSMLGAAIVAMASISLKVWRKGLSSLPFMLAQAAIAATLLVKQFQSYSQTKKLFPSGLYIFMSVAMLCFYSYVVLSGGNPPPKKLSAASS